ncbi:MAG: A/G-specific adenine glycosylase [Candidatus Peregrinibacteria bacterium Greene0416_62]|nr:MAG: A/G-specific adenine glycosylase [Candidatus Peregrinibacteria bacterium Greene0416_62]
MNRVVRIQAFVETIWQWYSHNKRMLPWRDLPDADPALRAYKVMISEIMLQQTQVSRVKIVFKDFLERFPYIQNLAQASNREVLLAWRGMGYNSRALRLRDAAQKIVAGYGLRVTSPATRNPKPETMYFPSSMEELQSIPGIGNYTAAAIRNFAFNIPTPCLDTNIRRILHRTFVGPEKPDGMWKKDDAYLLELAGEILQTALERKKHNGKCKNIVRTPAEWHAALMDFGSMIQTKRNPKWEACPLTASGIMKTSPQALARAENRKSQIVNRKSFEPGRLVGTRLIPNRIFRGKVIEELRDAAGLSLETIGKNICIDWSKTHRKWLQSILDTLLRERMLQVQKGRYRLFEG